MNKDIMPFDDKGRRHGYWKRYRGNKLVYKCTYANGLPVGYDEYRNPDGSIIKKYWVR